MSRKSFAPLMWLAVVLTSFLVPLSASAQGAVASQPQSGAAASQPQSEEESWFTVTFGVVGAVIGAAIAAAVQEILKQRIVQGYLSPPRIGPKDRRNSILALGLTQVGKTTLIRKVFEDEDANPAETTTEYQIYSKQTTIRGTTYHMYVSDYAGQDIGSLVSAFLLQQKQRFSPMSYGHVNSVILIVDIFVKPNRDDPDPDFLDAPLQERVNQNLEQWNDLAIDAVFGLLTEDTFKYFCLFINKTDLLRDQSPEALRQYEDLFADLRDLIARRARKEKQKIDVEVIVGSAEKGAGTNQIREKLREHSIVGQRKPLLAWR